MAGASGSFPFLCPADRSDRLEDARVSILIEIPDDQGSTMFERFDLASHLEEHFGQAMRR
jgi:hypothetical protein